MIIRHSKSSSQVDNIYIDHLLAIILTFLKSATNWMQVNWNKPLGTAYHMFQLVWIIYWGSVWQPSKEMYLLWLVTDTVIRPLRQQLNFGWLLTFSCFSIIHDRKRSKLTNVLLYSKLLSYCWFELLSLYGCSKVSHCKSLMHSIKTCSSICFS